MVGARRHRLPIHYTAYGDESDPGPFPVPKGAPVEGGQRDSGDRHVLVIDRRWDDENLNQLKRIPGSAFEVVKSAAGIHAC